MKNTSDYRRLLHPYAAIFHFRQTKIAVIHKRGKAAVVPYLGYFTYLFTYQHGFNFVGVAVEMSDFSEFHKANLRTRRRYT